MSEDGKRMSLYGKEVLTPQEELGFWKNVVWVRHCFLLPIPTHWHELEIQRALSCWWSQWSKFSETPKIDRYIYLSTHTHAHAHIAQLVESRLPRFHRCRRVRSLALGCLSTPNGTGWITRPCGFPSLCVQLIGMFTRLHSGRPEKVLVPEPKATPTPPPTTCRLLGYAQRWRTYYLAYDVENASQCRG